MSVCEWCAYNDSKYLLYKSLHWSVYLSDIQDYVGRCIVVSNRHCTSLSELDIAEWMDLKKIIDQLEYIYQKELGAKLCNWSCLMNSFYKETTPNPHLHIHMRPRYKDALIMNNHAYVDSEFAHHYALKKESVLSDKDKQVLYARIKKYFH